MNLSDTSSIVTIALGLVAVAGWLWKLFLWFQSGYRKAKENSETVKKFARDLVSHATDAEKQADIYLYFILNEMESKTRKIQFGVRALGFVFLSTTFIASLAFARHVLNISYSDPWLIVAIAAFTGSTLSFFMSCWFTLLIRKLEGGLNDGLFEALHKKIEGHIP